MFLRKIDKVLKPLTEFYAEDAVVSMNKYGKVITLAPGQVFFEEGKGGAEAAVIIEGTAKVTSGGKTLSILRAGTLVGEAALLTGEPRNASVQAASLLKIVVLDREAFTQTMNRSSSFRAQVSSSMQDRAA